MNQHDDFLKQTKQQLDDSAKHLDAATLSRLNQARQAALQNKQKPAWFQSLLIPAAITAALSILIINQWMLPSNNEPAINLAQQQMPANDLELLTSNTEFEMLEELDFINWLMEEENAG